MSNETYTERAQLHCAELFTAVSVAQHISMIRMYGVVALTCSYLEGDTTHYWMNEPGVQENVDATYNIDFPPSQGRLQRLERFYQDHMLARRERNAPTYDSFDLVDFVVASNTMDSEGYTVRSPQELQSGEPYYVASNDYPNQLALLGTTRPGHGLTLPSPEISMLAVIDWQDLQAVFRGAEIREPLYLKPESSP